MHSVFGEIETQAQTQRPKIPAREEHRQHATTAGVKSIPEFIPLSIFFLATPHHESTLMLICSKIKVNEDRNCILKRWKNKAEGAPMATCFTAQPYCSHYGRLTHVSPTSSNRNCL